MRYLFISHCSSDESIAHDFLRCAGAIDGVEPTLVAARQLAGQNYVQAIHDAIHGSTDAIILWSAAARESRWVLHEVDSLLVRFIEEGPSALRLVFVRLDSTDVPPLARPLHHLSFEGSTAATVEQALQQPPRTPHPDAHVVAGDLAPELLRRICRAVDRDWAGLVAGVVPTTQAFEGATQRFVARIRTDALRNESHALFSDRLQLVDVLDASIVQLRRHKHSGLYLGPAFDPEIRSRERALATAEEELEVTLMGLVSLYAFPSNEKEKPS